MQLDALEQDKIKEVINIGAGQSLSALNKIIHHPVSIQAPEVFVEQIDRASSSLGVTDQIVNVVLLQMTGEGAGLMMMVFDPESGIRLADNLTNRPGEDEILDELDQSALKEIGNMVSGSSMTAFNKLLGIDAKQSPPDVATDMYNSILHSILAEMGQESEQILLVKVMFEVTEIAVKGHLIFLFTPQSSQYIINAADKLTASP